MYSLNKIEKPNYIFADYVESGALDQFIETMNQPSVIRGALMPDAHQGYTVPIGCVFETEGIIYPSAVGFDISCGMCAVKTNFDPNAIKDNAQAIYNQILKNIPVGFNHRNKPVDECYSLNMRECSFEMIQIFNEKKGCHQLGTLGSGNHFWEIGVDENNQVWIIIHSGSRGVGHGCATHYMKLASPNGKASDGHYGFDVDSQNGKNYIMDMNWCHDYALLNRKVMLVDGVMAINSLGIPGGFRMDEIINRNHNHAESKDGLHWIHRKGATHAEEGMMGVIPGNMRDGSFIVRGKGNPESLCSSSHGAGRVLGRAKAKQLIDLEDFTLTMDGIVANVSEDTKDESPFAYKNIYEVMELQKDLVEVVAHVKPILNVKG